MLNIIINADDLGSFQTGNDAIFRLMSLGKISSSTLIANGPHFTNAIHRMKQFPQYSFGVHLNLSQFEPLTSNEIFTKYHLLDDQNQFCFKKFIFPTPQLMTAIREEWYTQIARIIDHGVKVSHLDSHQHMHTRFWMFPILKFLVQKFNIKKIRSKFSSYYYSRNGHLLRRFIRQLYGSPHYFMQKYLLHLKTPDHFANIHDGIDFLSTYIIKRPITIELMCHPGIQKFEKDFLFLLDNYESKICSPYRLISYHDL
ncbi:MAG: ChbG/HpnK family deacetylase [Puniceicoccales bacterium]|jgi:predicted glycoside hydrolase/deacetylase ChbG (UPF0249 family)|nr:ChbG/HpnK family deacetylase [Puniceicoccales bacterium]